MWPTKQALQRGSSIARHAWAGAEDLRTVRGDPVGQSVGMRLSIGDAACVCIVPPCSVRMRTASKVLTDSARPMCVLLITLSSLGTSTKSAGPVAKVLTILLRVGPRGLPQSSLVVDVAPAIATWEKKVL
jgi:hypothetical protein